LSGGAKNKIKTLENAGVSISPTPAMIGETLLETIAN
jgi:succinyl-CoA synthetase alpha subunit